MKKVLKCIRDILKYVLVCIIIIILMCIIQDEGLIRDDDLAFIFANLASVVVFMIMIKLEKKNVKEYLKIKTLKSRSIIALIALAVGIFLIDLSLTSLLSNYLPSNNSGDEITFTFVIYITLVAPICEEILFRGIVFTKLKSSFNLILAVFIQALFFGLAHGGLSGNVVQSVHAGLTGVIYGITFLLADSILAPILLHFLNNFFVTVIILFGFGEVTNQPHFIISLLGITIFIVAAKVLFNITHGFSHEDKCMLLKQ
ncbi:CPBP family intramembrane glutamic endopeptidase [Clostridium sp.]|uniref:CPBP family intramembrane glutamic endopeptidase n=1 Tax=Clostridium sp. TaxID=1506 RepID=UPI0028462CCD|nr:CPBP family intramembrane glutamic endopeptidase [Clostridium sp.]MDR3595620.1 CPBP family intramembrane metalloprotease [Clostridium sp.]